MIEIYVIYDQTPFEGYIVTAGRIDRDADAGNPDGSTTLERISRYLTAHPSCSVIYLPEQPLPDRERVKVRDGQLVPLESGDKTNEEMDSERKAEAWEKINGSELVRLAYTGVDAWVEEATDLEGVKDKLKEVTTVLVAVLKLI